MAKFDAEALGLKKTTKHAPLPGTTEEVMDTPCPACLVGKLVKVKPCCGSPRGSILCPRCGYKEHNR